MWTLYRYNFEMFSTMLRKAKTLLTSLDDFNSNRLASFSILDEGLKERRVPINPEVLRRVSEAYRAAKRDQHSFGSSYEANGEWRSLIADKNATIDHNIGSSLENFFRDEKTSSGIREYAGWHLLSQKIQIMARIIFVNAMLYDYGTWGDWGVRIPTGTLPIAVPPGNNCLPSIRSATSPRAGQAPGRRATIRPPTGTL
jgi:hypothetical protein